jgi:SAM-dependent methyltransferase
MRVLVEQDWAFACPACRSALAPEAVDAQRCSGCGAAYRRVAGIWRFLAPGRDTSFREFVDRYGTVRSDEGRSVRDPRVLRALPFSPPSRRHSYEWRIRARSYRGLLRHVVEPLERRASRSLRIVDLGSGLGWLAHRLTLRGHRVAAVDIVTNDFDGLGVHHLFGGEFTSVEAEFDRLPWAEGSADLVVYNASFHYSTRYEASLSEALRVLADPGRIVVMDSPLYRDPASGAAMIREREAHLRKKYAFRDEPARSEGFLTYARLAALEKELGIRWELIEPWYGVRWWLKPWIARARGTREVARFKLIVGRRDDRGAPRARPQP